MRTRKSKANGFLQPGTVGTLFQLFALLILCIANSLYTVPGHANELDKVTLKALYTYKFGKFTAWPEKKLTPASNRFLYCILGQSQFSQTMKILFTGKSVKEIPVSIEVFNSGLVPEEVLSTCHVVFISQSEKHRLSTIFSSLKQMPVLTISDIQHFSHQGGMVTITEDQGNFRFQINPDALQLAGLSMSSKILELAEIINDGDR